jgi:hypothetical protein
MAKNIWDWGLGNSDLKERKLFDSNFLSPGDGRIKS